MYTSLVLARLLPGCGVSGCKAAGSTFTMPALVQPWIHNAELLRTEPAWSCLKLITSWRLRDREQTRPAIRADICVLQDESSTVDMPTHASLADFTYLGTGASASSNTQLSVSSMVAYDYASSIILFANSVPFFPRPPVRQGFSPAWHFAIEGVTRWDFIGVDRVGHAFLHLY